MPVFTPMTSTAIPAAKQISIKRKKLIFFSCCVHTSNAKDNSKLNGVAARKKFLSKYNKPNRPMV
jgi:hypothetical protein